MEELFEQWAGEPCLNKIQITANGSNRLYYRLEGETKSCIAAINKDVRENEAFFFFAKEMAKRGVKVPEVYAISEDRTTYIQEDLGNVTIYTFLASRKTNGVDVTEQMRDLYKRAIDNLIEIQTACRDIDFSNAYPRPCFDRQAIQWDLDYFKYYFLKLFHVSFDEQLLERDFQTFMDYLLDEDCGYFMYRDFQSRNIMLYNDELYFIDFQGGRKGPIYYDVASFVWQARSRYPENLRKEMVQTYLTALKGYMPVDEERFHERLRLFVLFRTLQVLGAYGFRGYFEKKPHFLASVPYALSNLRKLLETPFSDYPYLNTILGQLASMPELNEIPQDHRLSVHIYSFAYKKGIPADTTGNGGGYVFDCRSVNNPGKYEYYRQFNGTDPEVIKFLEDDGEVFTFLDSVYKLVDAHAKRFIERKFTNLQVCFGCTGGQHRSVYCAEHMARHLKDKFDIKVTVTHRELNVEKML